MRIRVLAASLVCAAALCSGRTEPTGPIEIPLQYFEDPEWDERKLKISAVAVSGQELPASASAKPEALFVAGNPDTMSGIAIDPGGAGRGQAGGRAYCQETNIGLTLNPVPELGRARDCFVSVDYFDDLTSATGFDLTYVVKGKDGTSERYENVEGPTFTGTGAWKRFQFHLKDPGFLDPLTRREQRMFRLSAVQTGFAHGWGMQEILMAAPAGDWKIPELTGPSPFFVLADFAGMKRLFAFDRAQAGDSFYTRLRFDSNGNHDLRDETPLVTRVSEWWGGDTAGQAAGFDLKTSVTIAGSRVPYRCEVNVSGESSPRTGEPSVPVPGVPSKLSAKVSSVDIRPKSYYAGEFDFGGKHLRVALGDTNGNGTFDDTPRADASVTTNTYPGVPFQGADMLVISDGRFVPVKGASFCRKIVLGGRLFDVDLQLGASRMLLTPSRAPETTLEFPSVSRMALISADPANSIMFVDPGTRASITAGKYGLIHYTRILEENAGSTWTLSARVLSPKPMMETRADSGPVRLTFGEPYVPVVEVTPHLDLLAAGFGAKGKVSLDFTMRGATGEVVNSLYRTGDGPSGVELSPKSKWMPAEPKYVVAKPDGELVTRGSFEYG